MDLELRAAYDRIDALVNENSRLQTHHDMLRAALVALVGSSSLEDLEATEAVLRSAPAPAQDIAVAIDAIHALIATGAKADGR